MGGPPPSGGQVDDRYMTDVAQRLLEIVPAAQVLTGEAIIDDYTHDESLRCTPVRPVAVVQALTTDDVVAVLSLADELRVPVTARGSGTGLSGACVPSSGGILLSFERMNRIVEIDTDNQVAVVQPGVTLAQLDEATAAHGLVYPVFPGESSASLGGNVATNAGGMRAVKYGVTRHQVLGLQAVLATGEVIRTGGKFVKATSGYDLTQLILGSEGTLAVVTEVVLRLYPRPAHSATLLVPFRSITEIAAAVPRIISSGANPLLLEYIDALAMAATAANVGLDLGFPDAVQEAALAYLVVVLESSRVDRLDEEVAALGGLLEELGSLEVYVLPPGAAAQLLEAREQAFWVAKQLGADDIVDVVVPRASIPDYLDAVSRVAARHATTVVGAGHAGDGNVHLSVFQPDPVERAAVMQGIFEAGLALGGAISAEHGIGTEKKDCFLALEDPTKLRLMRAIKLAFDPHSILNPGKLFTSTGDRT
jgi:glycolate oxidase